MKKTHILMAGVVVGLTAVVSFADTKDSWKLKMNLNDGTNKTLMLEGIDSIVLGDSEKPEVKPGDVDDNGEPLLMDVSYNHYYEWEWYHHNLSNNTYPVVERTRTFSDGTVLTDEFRDYGHPCDIWGYLAIHSNGDDRYIDNGMVLIEGEMIPHLTNNMRPQDYTRTWSKFDIWDMWKRYETIDGKIPTQGERFILNKADGHHVQTDTELSFTITHSIGVDYLNEIDILHYNQSMPYYGSFNRYHLSKIYRVENSEGVEIENTTAPIDSIYAWYYNEILHRFEFSISRKNNGMSILFGGIDYDNYDQYMR